MKSKWLERMNLIVRVGIVAGLAVFATLSWLAPALGSTLTSGPAEMNPPQRVAGAAGDADGRGADFFPAIAYDPYSQRYLVVWLTSRNADPNSGFEIYGVMLDQSGTPMTGEFAISDGKTAARNIRPTVAGAYGGFVVAWTEKTTPCRIMVQRVVDSSPQPDYLLQPSQGHQHSPSLLYNPMRGRYALAYVDGDDYLPASLQGNAVSDCGNNPASRSRVRVIEFYFDQGFPAVSASNEVSWWQTGAFRPDLAYDPRQNRYLAVWEDRRQAIGKPYRFDVYAQLLDERLMITGPSLVLAAGGDYSNDDNTSSWTPRPVAAADGEQFQAAWFEHKEEGIAALWTLQSRSVSPFGWVSSPKIWLRFTYAQNRRSPASFLDLEYLPTGGEYIVGLSAYIDSELLGYYSRLLIQRVSKGGELLKMDGSLQAHPAVGRALDLEKENQLMAAIAVNGSGYGKPEVTDLLVVYSKHSRNQSQEDYDLWGARVQIPSIPTPPPVAQMKAFLPMSLRK